MSSLTAGRGKENADGEINGKKESFSVKKKNRTLE
jgi:hypothetical protein